MANYFNETDERSLLSRPGFFYYRDYGTNDPWKRAVFMNGASYQINTETSQIIFDDVGIIRDEISKETIEITVSSGQVLNLELIEDLTGGLYTYETVAGTPVSGATQTLTSGKWNLESAYLFENQNGDGTAPTVSSVVGATDGTLASTDYDLVKLEGAGWSIVLKTGGNITTESQDITITYDYTPAQKRILKRGGMKVIHPIELAFQTIAPNQDTGQDEFITFYFYRASSDGNLGHGFSPETSSEPISMDLKFTAFPDVNRPIGDQLYSVVRGDVELA
jgi:hypothetical protein